MVHQLMDCFTDKDISNAARYGSCVSDAVQIVAFVGTGGGSVAAEAAVEGEVEVGKVVAESAAEAGLDAAAQEAASQAAKQSWMSTIGPSLDENPVSNAVLDAPAPGATPPEPKGAPWDADLDEAMHNNRLSKGDITDEDGYSEGGEDGETEAKSEEEYKKEEEENLEELKQDRCGDVNMNGLEGALRTYIESQFMLPICARSNWTMLFEMPGMIEMMIYGPPKIDRGVSLNE